MKLVFCGGGAGGSVGRTGRVASGLVALGRVVFFIAKFKNQYFGTVSTELLKFHFCGVGSGRSVGRRRRLFLQN